MSDHIYVRNGDVVELYSVDLDRKRFIDIQKKIDDWNGKGALKKTVRSSLSEHCDDFSLIGKKVEIVSKTYINDEKVYIDDLFLFDTVPMYMFEYYVYDQHSLSKLCDTILMDYKVLDFSKHIKDLLEWTSDNEEEINFVRELLSCFQFELLSLDNVTKFSVDERKSLLNKILNVFKNDVLDADDMLVYPRSYNDAVDDKIRQEEYEVRKNCDKDFEFSLEEKNNIKKKVLTSIPVIDKIIKK